MNSDNEDETERLKKENDLKENYKVNSRPDVPDESQRDGKIRKTRVPKKDQALAEFEEKYKQIETGLNMFISIGMDFFAERMPKKIPVTQTEKEFFSASLETVLKKYKSSMIEYIPEIMLIASASVFIIPRMVKTPSSKPEKVNFEIDKKPDVIT